MSAPRERPDAYPPQRAVNEAIRRAARAALPDQPISDAAISYQQRGRVVAIRVEGAVPDPLVYADVNSLLSIAREIARGWQ
jgi:hypothetical protein